MNDKTKLRGKRIAILAGDGFEYVELSVPKLALAAAGADVEIVSLHEGRIRGMNLTEPSRTVKVDRTFKNADPMAYDGILVVGGFVGPDLLRQSAEARAFVRAFDEASKPIAVICHGPLLLVSAGILSGRRLAAWPGVRDDVVNAGGIWRDEAVVKDRNLVSSRGPQDLPVFVPAIVDLFARGRTDDVVLPVIESSPQALEPARPAVAAARALPGPAAWIVAGAALAATVGAVSLRKALS